MTNDVECLFICLFAIGISSLIRCLGNGILKQIPGWFSYVGRVDGSWSLELSEKTQHRASDIVRGTSSIYALTWGKYSPSHSWTSWTSHTYLFSLRMVENTVLTSMPKGFLRLHGARSRCQRWTHIRPQKQPSTNWWHHLLIGLILKCVHTVFRVPKQEWGPVTHNGNSYTTCLLFPAFLYLYYFLKPLPKFPGINCQIIYLFLHASLEDCF